MKAFGRRRQHPGNYENSKLQKGHIMWWEVEYQKVKSKKFERQNLKNEIEKELIENDF